MDEGKDLQLKMQTSLNEWLSFSMDLSSVSHRIPVYVYQ